MISHMMSLMMMSSLEGYIKAYVCQGTSPSVNDPLEEIWIRLGSGKSY